MGKQIAVFAAALLLAAAPALSAPAEVVDVNVRPGATMRYLAIAPEGQAKAAVILLAGGNGALRLSPTGTIGRLGGNFLIRSRELFARQGLFVAALDASSDNSNGMNGAIRLSARHAEDIGRVVADVRNRTAGAAVWLVGTSAGTLSAANAAARLSGAEVSMRPAGVVLTSTMTTLGAPECGKTVYDAPLVDIRVPVLVVSHENDACPCSPGSSVVGSRLLAACPRAPAKEHKVFTGGSPPVEPPCEARTAHGYLGLEASVVEFIAEWVKSH
jgi:pimeloyl-ACP methyl ester carboxylesterase